MATIMYGDENDFFSTAFNAGHNATMAANRMLLDMNRAVVNKFSAIGGAALDYVQAGLTKIQEVVTSNEFRALKGSVQQTLSAWDKNIVRVTKSLVQMQTATPIMQYYLMANPRVRELYYEGTLDGYSETYVDVQPGKIGEDHIAYRQVMSGSVIKEDGKEVIKTYVEGTKVEPLSIPDRIMIKRSWEAMNRELDKWDEDPTSIWCATLS